jgi:hypothetical protein
MPIPEMCDLSLFKQMFILCITTDFCFTLDIVKIAILNYDLYFYLTARNDHPNYAARKIRLNYSWNSYRSSKFDT